MRALDSHCGRLIQFSHPLFCPFPFFQLFARWVWYALGRKRTIGRNGFILQLCYAEATHLQSTNSQSVTSFRYFELRNTWRLVVELLGTTSNPYCNEEGNKIYCLGMFKNLSLDLRRIVFRVRIPKICNVRIPVILGIRSCTRLGILKIWQRSCTSIRFG